MLAKEAQTDGLPIEDRVAKNVRDLESWYASELERRLASLTEVLNTQLQAQVQEVREQYTLQAAALQLRAQEAQAHAQANAQAHAQAPAGATDSNRLFEEIKKIEGIAQKCSLELERMVADDTVNLGVLLQMRNQQLEVRAYLRGLKFCVEGPSAGPAIGH